MNNLGRSVRLFLVDGKSTGLITAEIMNWTGHVLTGPRVELPKFLTRPEVSRTGVYLLYGQDPVNADAVMLYIGESDNVGVRLKQHNQEGKKDYWERTCVITSKDQNITKAHARYLEARLIGIAKAAGRALVDNGTTPPPVALPEADQSDMEYFIDQIRLVLPVLGLEFFRESPKPSTDSGSTTTVSDPLEAGPLFELSHKKSGACAKAREIDGEFVVLKGAKVVSQWKQASTAGMGYAKLHDKLRESGILQGDPSTSLATLTQDVAFSSPSAAAAVVQGRSANGRLDWRLAGTQTNYAAWQDQQIESTVHPTPPPPQPEAAT
jgi:predicted GIY-YIG superfamily endonuclease